MALGFPYYSTMNSLGLVCFLWGISTFQSNKTGLRRSPRRFAVISTYFDIFWQLTVIWWWPSPINAGVHFMKPLKVCVKIRFGIYQSNIYCAVFRKVSRIQTHFQALNMSFGPRLKIWVKNLRFFKPDCNNNTPQKTWFTLGISRVNVYSSMWKTHGFLFGTWSTHAGFSTSMSVYPRGKHPHTLAMQSYGHRYEFWNVWGTSRYHWVWTLIMPNI